MPKTKPTPNPSPSTKRGGWRGRNPTLPVLVPHTLTVALTRTRSGAPTVLLASLLGTARSVALWWRSRSARITSGSDCERASNSVLRLSLVGCGELRVSRLVRERAWGCRSLRHGSDRRIICAAHCAHRLRHRAPQSSINYRVYGRRADLRRSTRHAHYVKLAPDPGPLRVLAKRFVPYRTRTTTVQYSTVRPCRSVYTYVLP